MILWETIGDDDSGAPVEMPGAADKTVTMVGTWASATLTMQGSNDNANWFSLTDPQGNAIALTADGMEVIMENPRYIRVLEAGGSGTVDVDVHCLARSTMR